MLYTSLLLKYMPAHLYVAAEILVYDIYGCWNQLPCNFLTCTATNFRLYDIQLYCSKEVEVPCMHIALCVCVHRNIMPHGTVVLDIVCVCVCVCLRVRSRDLQAR